MKPPVSHDNYLPGSLANRGRAIYNLMVAKGEKLYEQARFRTPLIRDHKLRLRTVTKCFTGAAFVSWLVEQKEVSKEDEAVILGQHLLENGIIHHGEDRGWGGGGVGKR